MWEVSLGDPGCQMFQTLQAYKHSQAVPGGPTVSTVLPSTIKHDIGNYLPKKEQLSTLTCAMPVYNRKKSFDATSLPLVEA